MSDQAWVAAVGLAVAITGGCGAWMMGVYRKLGSIEQGLSQFEDWIAENRLDRTSLWNSHNALTNRVTRLEAQQ